MKKSGTDAPAPAPEKTHTLYFAKANWPEVLDWFAKESGLTPILTIQPTGSVDIKPPMGKKFTMGEVVDLLNEAMAQQKFILIRRQVTFYIHPSDEKINATDVPRLELSELPTRGKTELVQVLIPLKSLTAEDAVPEIQKLLSPFGTVSPLSKINTLVVLDTAKNVSNIYKMIQEIEGESGELLTHVCKYKKAQDLADHLKTLLTDKSTEVLGAAQPGAQPFVDPRFGPGGGGYDPRFGPGGGGFDPRGRGRDGQASSRPPKSVNIAVDPKANSVTISAPPEKIAAAKKIIEEFDKGTTIFKPEDPELKKYAVPAGTADAIAKTLMADNPALRVIAVPAANELWVMATPTEHFELMKKIRESIQPGDTQQTTKSIQLAFSDPADMVAKLTKLYSSSNGGPIIETGAPGRCPSWSRGPPSRSSRLKPRSMRTKGPRPTAV